MFLGNWNRIYEYYLDELHAGSQSQTAMSSLLVENLIYASSFNIYWLLSCRAQDLHCVLRQIWALVKHVVGGLQLLLPSWLQSVIS
jgi:hypothetical protein